MKLNFLLAWLFFILSQICFSQNTIELINAVILEMKSEQAFYQQEEKYKGETGNRVVFYKEKEPKVISVKEQGRIEKNVSCYFKNKELIYTETNWRDSLSGNFLYKEKTYHYRNNLIAWLGNEGSFVDAASEEYKQLDRKLSSYGKIIFEEALIED